MNILLAFAVGTAIAATYAVLVAVCVVISTWISDKLGTWP